MSEEKELRTPAEGEVICIVERMLGADKLIARCVDGKTRLCRIPGKHRRRLWVKEGDVILVAVWDFQPDRRGDLVYKYRRDEIKKLYEKGYLPEEFITELGVE